MKMSKPKTSNRLFVGNINKGIREEDVHSLFRTFGAVSSVWLSENPPGFGFVEMTDAKDAEAAAATLDGMCLGGLHIRVEMTPNSELKTEELHKKKTEKEDTGENENKTDEQEIQNAVEEAVGEVFEEIRENIKSHQSEQKMKATITLPNMFGNIEEDNVIFCIDTSGSMYNSIDAIKEQVIAALEKKAEKTGGYFNLIEFNTEVTAWSDSMVQCNSQTVSVASDWVRNLQAKTGTNTLEALLTALGDPGCQSVYLITDGYPDQHPTEILDNVAAISDNRPIHCHYIKSTSSTDTLAVEFLRDLAMESYGSFYITSISNNGVIEQVTPIYRAEAAAERIIRTTNNNIYPSNYKKCTVSTTLDAPVNDLTFATSFWPYPYVYPFYRYYYIHPAQGWSHYRLSRSWMKTGDSIQEISGSLPFTAPGPGALLIGTKVLARRHHDGLYYLGTVKSQIFEHKFLIEFGPCKHGSYKKTSYQETFLFDIISHTDALRHAILPEDKVLAPWEPEGEKYGPGVVMSGQEKRTATGGVDDEELIVSFYNGRTATVAFNKAVWVPAGLHQRVEFELKLPSKVRMDLAANEDYPEESLPGYPTTKVMAEPPEYDVYNYTNWLVPPYLPYYYLPMFTPKGSVTGPVRHRKVPPPSQETGEIPGTGYTKDALNEKVMAQIMEHKMFLEDLKKEEIKERVRQKVDEKLLKKRDNTEENTLTKRHSVTFGDEVKVNELDSRDSGRGSATDQMSDLDLSDCEIDSDYELDTMRTGRESRSRGGRVRRRERRPRSGSRERKPWRYWGNTPIPDTRESNHYGPYRLGPYEPAFVPPVPLEKKLILKNQHGVEYTNSMSRFVEAESVHKYDASVRDSMYIPRPPENKPEKQGTGVEINIQFGEGQRQSDLQAQARNEFRRRQVLSRRKQELQQWLDADKMKDAMMDQRRQNVLGQLQWERDRAQQAHDNSQARLEAKRAMSADTRSLFESRQAWQHQRSELRDSALQVMRQRREALAEQQRQQAADAEQRRLAARQQKVQERNQRHVETMLTKEAEQAARDQQQRRAKSHRIEHFRQLEISAQKNKELQRHVSDQTFHLFRSEVLP